MTVGPHDVRGLSTGVPLGCTLEVVDGMNLHIEINDCEGNEYFQQ